MPEALLVVRKLAAVHRLVAAHPVAMLIPLKEWVIRQRC